MPLAASAVSRPTLHRLALTALAAATLALSACGGGDRAEEYQPKAMLVFGDEHSAFTTITVGSGGTAKTLQPITWGVDAVQGNEQRLCYEGTACDGTLTTDLLSSTEVATFAATTPLSVVFSVGADATALRTVITNQSGTYTRDGDLSTQNAQLVSSLTYLCGPAANIPAPNWVVGVARSFGLGFGSQTNCSTDGTGATNYAEVGAKVADVIAEMQAQRSQMRDGVLITVMVGHHDILELYTQVMAEATNRPAVLSSAESELQRRGRALASAIKSVTDTGAKVILAKTPDLSASPFANEAGQDAVAVLRRLSDALNQAVYVNQEISRLGRSVAGVDTDEIARVASSSSGYVNGAAACDPDKLVDPETNTLLDESDSQYSSAFDYFTDMGRVCTNLTLKTGVNPSNYVWATPIHLGPGAHSYIGSVAFNRAANQF
jgi:lysophospholipase L1-like esterase